MGPLAQSWNIGLKMYNWNKELIFTSFPGGSQIMWLTPHSVQWWNRTTLWISWDLQWKVNNRIILNEKGKNGLSTEMIMSTIFPFPSLMSSISLYRTHLRCMSASLFYYCSSISVFFLDLSVFFPTLYCISEFFLLREMFRYLKHICHCWLFSSLIFL